MPSDFYTRAVLTVIAISLAVIAWKLPLINVGHAQLGGCGGNPGSPCFIAATDVGGFGVNVINASDFRQR